MERPEKYTAGSWMIKSACVLNQKNNVTLPHCHTLTLPKVLPDMFTKAPNFWDAEAMEFLKKTGTGKVFEISNKKVHLRRPSPEQRALIAYIFVR